jgi:hypothetical protein
MVDRERVRLNLRLTGPTVDDNRLPLSELERVSKKLRATLRDIAIVLSNHGPSGRSGRVAKFIETAVDLEVVGAPRAGSFVLDLEAPSAAPTGSQLFDDLGPDLAERSIRAFVSGLDRLTDETEQLPEGFDRGVLGAIGGFAQTFSKGVDEIVITASDGQSGAEVAHLDRDRVALAKRLVRRPVKAQTALEGVLRMVDDRTLECRIEHPPSTSVTCFFDEKDRNVVWKAGTGRQIVRISGEGEFVPGEHEPRRIWASSIRVLYEELSFDQHLFWRKTDIDTLAREQQPSTVHALPDANDWRDDLEADALIAAIWDDE